MSFISKIFEKGKKEEEPNPQEAIKKLRTTEEMLIKKSEFLETKIESEIKLARQNAQKNKRVALQALKRKNRYEKQLKQIDGSLSTIEYQRNALENANTNTEVLKIMSYAAKALKNSHQNMDVDKVHDLMDDVAEQQDVAKEISDAISNPIGFGQDYDEDELNAELEELEQEELDKQLLEVTGPTPSALPSTPTSSIGQKTQSASTSVPIDDEELKNLEAWAT